MVSAEEPDAIPVEHYDGLYSMTISLGGGQGEQCRIRQQQVGRVAELSHPARQHGLRQRGGTRTRRPVPDDNGKIAAIGWDVTGGQKYWYVTLAGQPGHVYVGTVASVGPALVLAQTGDPVTISILNVGAQESTQSMQSFTDARIPLNAPGS